MVHHASCLQGLSQDCMAYVEAHTSNAYDESCLRKFAAGLLAAGLQDEAATVFYGLLQRDGDRAQQVRQPPSRPPSAQHQPCAEDAPLGQRLLLHTVYSSNKLLLLCSHSRLVAAAYLAPLQT